MEITSGGGRGGEGGGWLRIVLLVECIQIILLGKQEINQKQQIVEVLFVQFFFCFVFVKCFLDT